MPCRASAPVPRIPSASAWWRTSAYRKRVTHAWPISMTLNLGACVGLVIGGVVAHASGSYVREFWAPLIVGAVLLFGVGSPLPGATRNFDGNGKDPARSKGWQHSWLGLVAKALCPAQKKPGTEEVRESSLRRSPNTTTTTRASSGLQRYGLDYLSASFRIFYRDTLRPHAAGTRFFLHSRLLPWSPCHARHH